MTYRVLISDRAAADIREAFLYIHDRSPRNANVWLEGLYLSVEGLATFPEAYGGARESDAMGRSLRQYVYKSHRIIFEVSADVVRVAHVIHAARDPIDADRSDPSQRSNSVTSSIRVHPWLA